MLRRRLLLGAAGMASAQLGAEPEKRVLQVRFPNVEKVELAGVDFPAQSMKTIGADLFEAELSLPARLNRYRYKLKVGQTTLADPSNPLRIAEGERLRAGNVLWHPLAVHEAWVAGKIKRGRLERIFVPCSQPTPHEQAVWVHTPAGYEGRTKGLPALYLLHGAGGSGLSYCADDLAPDLSETLLSLGKVRPFLTVMPDVDPSQGSIPPNPYNIRTQGMLWMTELVKRMGKLAELLRTEIIPAVERRYGLRADWRSRAVMGNSGGGTITLMLEADSKSPYAKVLGPSAMFNPPMNDYFFNAIDRRGENVPRPRLIASAGRNDPASELGKAQNLSTVDDYCRAFGAQAEQRGMLHKMSVHDYGHSGGPEMLVEVMEAAYGR
jgi:enterochelin esterase-like enzyme